jgi:signal transduction histidine kinase/ActR/RegA family two-component response regulator
VTPNTVLTRQDLPSELADLLRARRPAIVNQPMRMESLDRHLLRSVSVPVVSQDKILGFVTVADRSCDYDQNDVAGLVALTGYLAPILEFHLDSLAKEEQLRQAQKMEAVGALAGGIAHDFNNILQAILGFSTLALEEARTLETRPGGFIANDLERVVRATQRGRDLVNRIRMFSRREEVERLPTDIAPLVAETVDLLRKMIPATISVRAEITAGCAPVLTDPMQISQILLNLATNAFHAMEETGGDLVFGLRPVPAGSRDPHVPPALAAQDLVELAVTDTGCGMDAATLGRLYDPFFTTKEVDKGTGLGLSVVHGIVTSHRGGIEVESAIGSGSTIRIFLPTAAAAEPTPTASVFAGGSATRVPVGPLAAGRRILFLDDEPDIMDLGRTLLEKQGHQVKALSDPQAALLHLQRPDSVFDLLITDLTMPHMTGLQFAEQVGRIRPDLPIVLITGMNETRAEAWADYPGIRGLLHKPFTGDALREIIANVLEREECEPDTEAAAAPPVK